MQRLHWGRAVSDKSKQMGPNESGCMARRDWDGRRKKKERKGRKSSEFFIFWKNESLKWI